MGHALVHLSESALFWGIFGPALGVFAAWLFYVLTIRRDRLELSWSVRNFVLVQNTVSTIEHLQVSYDGVPAKTLSSAKVIVWNSGQKNINYDADLNQRPEYMLRLVPAAPAVILDAHAIVTNAETSAAGIRWFPAEKTPPVKELVYQIGFDYLKPGEGMVLDVVHTGTSHRAVNVQGEFKTDGTLRYRPTNPSPILDMPLVYKGRRTPLRAFFAWTFSVSWLIFTVLFNIVLLNEHQVTTWRLLLIDALYLGFLAFPLVALRRVGNRRVVPDGLAAYFD